MAKLTGIYKPVKEGKKPKAKTAKAKTAKAKTAKPKTTKNPTRENLVREIALAEFDAIGKKRPGQIWYKPTGGGGELWTTHFSEGDNYLPSAASKKFLLLYVATPKTLNAATGRKIADEPREGEKASAFYIEELRKYARGDYSHKFDPKALAEKIEKYKITPALEALKKKTGKTGNPEPAAEKPDGPSLLDICSDVELDEKGRVELDKTVADALFAAAGELAFLYERLALESGVDKEAVDAAYPDDALEVKKDPTKILEFLRKMRKVYNDGPTIPEEEGYNEAEADAMDGA